MSKVTMIPMRPVTVFRPPLQDPKAKPVAYQPPIGNPFEFTAEEANSIAKKDKLALKRPPEVKKGEQPMPSADVTKAASKAEPKA